MGALPLVSEGCKGIPWCECLLEKHWWGQDVGRSVELLEAPGWVQETPLSPAQAATGLARVAHPSSFTVGSLFSKKRNWLGLPLTLDSQLVNIPAGAKVLLASTDPERPP